ncbi:hypothetical protein CC79DRAFT_813286 [Sarocladium strictum]
MALPLCIPPCIRDPVHVHHPPPLGKPLRIHIEGPLASIKRLVPDVEWHVDVIRTDIWQPAAEALARVTFKNIYKRDPQPDIDEDLKVRDEMLGWIHHQSAIDTYGVTFDHLVPPGENWPEFLQINIIDMDEDEGEYANEVLPFEVDSDDFVGKKVLAVPRCCQKRKGSTDRARINGQLTHGEMLREGYDWEPMMRLLSAHGLCFSRPPDIVQCDHVPAPPSGKWKKKQKPKTEIGKEDAEAANDAKSEQS